MKSAETAPGSAPVPTPTQAPCPLYKPLWELTEDDIAQVTREDCRRFLKEKGMRRPSWNKSQAIQQVISLKALLEPKPDQDEEEEQPHRPQQREDEDDDEEGEDGDGDDDDDGARDERRASSSSSLPKPPAEPLSPPAGSLPPPGPPPPPLVSRDFVQLPPPFRANYPETPYRRRDPPAAAAPPFAPGDASTSSSSFRVPVAAQREAFNLRPEVAGVSPRLAAPPDPVTGEPTQMTIFYGGRVNVYESVPTDKAVSIMQFAGSRDPGSGWDFPSPHHHQRQQVQQSQLLMHYNNGQQQSFRLVPPPGTFGSDNPAAAPFRQPNQQSPPAPFDGCSGGERDRQAPHPVPQSGPRQSGLDQQRQRYG